MADTALEVIIKLDQTQLDDVLRRARELAESARAEFEIDFVDELLENAPDEWDDDTDTDGDATAVAYVHHLEAEVDRLGGCRRRWCRNDPEQDSGPCDHGRP